jgi:hypothetical protein
MRTSVSRAWLLLLLLVGALAGCVAEDVNEDVDDKATEIKSLPDVPCDRDEEARCPGDYVPPPPPPRPAHPGTRLGLYFIDGSSQDEGSGTNIWDLHRHVSPLHLVNRYYKGPALLCRVDGSCRDRREALATQICADIRDNRIDVFAVFGYSRGAILANVAARDAAGQCADLFPGGVESRYVFGGFIDAVAYGIEGWKQQDMPRYVSWFHIHRKRHWRPHWFKVDKFSGFGGENRSYGSKGTSHAEMGFETPVLDQMIAEANYKIRIVQGIPDAPFW